MLHQGARVTCYPGARVSHVTPGKAKQRKAKQGQAKQGQVTPARAKVHATLGRACQQCLDACPRSLRSRGLEPKWLRTMMMMMMMMMLLMMMKLCLAKDPRSRLEKSLTALIMLSLGRVCHMQLYAGYGARFCNASSSAAEKCGSGG